jgi:hypothetical protein
MEPVRSSETSVNIYQAKRQHIPEDNIQEVERFLERRHSHGIICTVTQASCLTWAHVRKTCHEIHYNQCIPEYWTGMISWHSMGCLRTTNYRSDRFLYYFTTWFKLLRLYRVESDSDVAMNGGQISLERGAIEASVKISPNSFVKTTKTIKKPRSWTGNLRLESGSSLIKV